MLHPENPFGTPYLIIMINIEKFSMQLIVILLTCYYQIRLHLKLLCVERSIVTEFCSTLLFTYL